MILIDFFAYIFSLTDIRGFEIGRGFLKKRGSGVVGSIGKDWRKPSMGTDDGSVRRASAHRPVLPGRPTSRIVSWNMKSEE